MSESDSKTGVGDVSADDVDNSDSASTSSNKHSDGAASVHKSKLSAIPKPSGIKPPQPSRIGRPCLGQQQKPAVPATPTKNGSEDSARRLADDLGRHRLTDVQEENEDDVGVNPVNTSRRTRYSSIGSTASSMDYLWDLHPRRLSEAGLSRHSDNSTILTEDTDSFIIGQRVWVGGTKPGTIAYIGDTQFAPGEWAGIVLDQPIGKNDGSVGGTRYFQCESKKGVFSRLTRLTRYPLGNAEMGSGDHVSVSPLNNGARRSPISPSGSLSPFKSPPSLNTSTTSLASTVVVDYKIGDRVIIKSSQGSKIGVLRYIGGADFAPGEWCGVELDEPRGKNDGSVEGKRYFDCRPNFGLFAPITKVSRSPSNRKPGNCVVHSGPGIPPSGFKRANSRESLASNTSITSAASGVRRVRLGVTSLTHPQKISPKVVSKPIPTRTALQEVLKEKQQHIEQLLKERDLERAEIARASSQADENEQKYATLKQEYEQYKAEYDKKFLEHMDLLARLKIDHEELLANVEDEKRKNEDLQFRYEEASITKSDIEQRLASLNVANETNIIEIKNLEERLAAEQRKIEALEGDSNKLFEAEEQMVRMREENEILRYEVEVATTKILSVESECMSAKDSINSLKREVNELQIVLRERDETIEKIQSDDKKISVEFSDAKVNFNQELDGYKKQLESSSVECLQQKKLVEVLQSDLSQTKQMLDEKTKSFEALSCNLKDFEGNMGKELEKLKMEVSAKSLDVETSGEVIKAKDEEIKAIKAQLETLKAQQETQSVDVDKYKENMKATENALRKELEECKTALQLKITEVEEAKKEFVVTLSNKTNEINEANKTVQTYLSTIEELKTDLSKIKEAFAEGTRDVQSHYERQLKEADGKIGSLASELHQMNEDFSKSTDLIAKLEIELGSKNDRLLRSETELNATKRQLETETTSSVALNNTVNNLQLRVGDLERLLTTSEDKINELAGQKLKLLGEVQSLIDSSGDYSAKLDELTKELRGKDGVIDSLKEGYASKLRDIERAKQELELNYKDIVLKNERERLEHEEKIKQITASEESLKLRYETHLIESAKATEDLNAKLKVLQNDVNEKNLLLQKLQAEKINGDKMKDAFEKKCNELQSTISDLESKISALTVKNVEAVDDLSKKSMELIEAERKYNELSEQSKLTEAELKAAFEERFRKLEVEISERESEKLKLAEKSNTELCEKLDQLDRSRTELQANHEKILLGIERDKTEHEAIVKNMSVERDTSIRNFEKIIAAKEQSINDLNVKIKQLEGTLVEKDALLKNIDDEAREKETKLKQELGKASGDLQSNLCEYQKKIERLEKENNEMKLFIVEKTTEFIGKDTEFNALVEKTKQRETEIKEILDELAKKYSSEILSKDVQIQQLNVDLQEMKVGVSKTEVASGEMNEQIAQLKSELKFNHQFVDKLQNENKNLSRRLEENDEARDANAKQRAEMNDKLSQLTAELQKVNDTSCNLKSLNEYYETVLKLLKLTHKQKTELLQTSSKNCTYWNAEGSNKLVELVENIVVGDDREVDEKISQLQGELVKYEQLQQEAENTIKLQTAEIIRLGDELKKNSEVSRTTNGTSKIAVPVSSKVANNQSSNKQLMEEKLFAENQVAFLNSIIVDMQKKNEEQKVRIEILESGYSPNAVDELKLFGFADRKLPPRMYCDICEEFDLHETEDCPQQANEDLPSREKSPKDIPPQRPYCDICEAFGHMTEDCQEDQTF